MELFEFTSDHGAGGVAYYLNAAGVSLRLFKMTRYMLGMQILKETSAPHTDLPSPPPSLPPPPFLPPTTPYRAKPAHTPLPPAVADAYTSLFIPSFLLFMMCCLLGTILFAVEYDFEDPDNGSRVPDVTTAWWMVLAPEHLHHTSSTD